MEMSYDRIKLQIHKGKYMFINSQYDEWAISNILKIKCLQKGSSGETPKTCTTD